MSDKVCSLDDAVDHVRAGDAVHIVTNHSRWTAAARHLVRRWWGQDPGFTLVMLSLSSLGALFFRGNLVKKVVTGYSGDIFPNFSPNPWFADAYLRGEVEVEHWSFLTFLQRLEAAARGLPAVTTGSLDGSSMASNPGYARVETPFGEVGLLEAYAPDIALLHAPIADRHGNLAFNAPRLEGVWGALAARRGVVATVERVVDDIRPWSHLVQVPAHRVLAVAESPMGAHPGGLFSRDTPVPPYGEDLEFWSEVRTASHVPDFDEWIEQWVLGPATQQEYLERLGPQRTARLRRRAEADQVLVRPVGGPCTTLFACLGAAQVDRHGNINSTVNPGKVFLVGAGGGNDVASTADEVVVMSTLTPRRAVADVPYVTSVGRRVRALITDLAVFEKAGADELALTAVAPGEGSPGERIERVRSLCPWDLRIADPVGELDPPDPAHIEMLRRWDPQGRFLRPDA